MGSERLKRIVEQSGGSLTSTQVLPSTDEEAFQRVSVNARMSVSIEAFQKVLHELESGLPALVVDNVVVLARGARSRRRTRRNRPLGLDVRFRLSGYLAATNGPELEPPAASG